MGENVVIVAAARTAVGSFNGSLAGISAADSGALEKDKPGTGSN